MSDRRVEEARIVTRCPCSIALALVAASPLSAVTAVEEPPIPSSDFEFALELKQSDLNAIRMDVLQRFPILAASPGIKFARGERGFLSGGSAHVVFFPHSETRGVKNALQAHCLRDTAESQWSCPIVETRRYVELDTQDYEVRVVADIDLDGVLALKEATNPLMLATRPSPSVDTLMVIFAVESGYIVGWGSEDERETVTLQVRLRDGGHAANAGDWNVSVFRRD
ncbi:MAG TPA: hypothetical protein VNQ14_04325 [Woeseiaceae bacterium]|nr:hypothetical protein [Woeseiaceae bacterium]